MLHVGHLVSKLIPTQCYLCKALGSHDTPNLCPACEYQLPYLKNYCYQCALPLATPDHPCGKCLKTNHSYDESYCALLYQPPASNLIPRAKYNRELACLSTLGNIFVKGYKKYRHKKHHITPDVIVPIPLSRKRQLTRGFNQSQYVAKIASDEFDIPFSNQILKRSIHTRPQQGLSRAERLRNLKHSFVSSAKVKGLNIVLFDDVITTGATMESAASTLKKAGAASVLAWSIARTA